MTWLYVQENGCLYDWEGRLYAQAHSGFGPHINWPPSQCKKNYGTIPAGHWSLHGLYNTGSGDRPEAENPYRGSNPFLRTNPFIIELFPIGIHGTCGRDGFYVHGGSGIGASRGCIVLEPWWKRESMYNSGDRRLLVVDRDPFLHPDLGQGEVTE